MASVQRSASRDEATRWQSSSKDRDSYRKAVGINVRPAASQIMHEWALREDLAAISDGTPTAFLRDLKTGQMTMRSILMDASVHPGRVPHGTT